MAQRINNQEVVRKVLESKAIDFAAIGKVVGELGPSLSMADEPWDVFCGTMRTFVRVFVIRGPLGGPLEGLGELRNVANEIKG